MAIKKQIGLVKWQIGKQHTRTSIGKSVNTSPKNKSKKRNYKKYRGQG